MFINKLYISKPMQYAKSRAELLKLQKPAIQSALYNNSICAIEALDKLGVGGLEQIGISDGDIHAWLSSPNAGYHRNRLGGDIKSVLLAANWAPDRYEAAMRQNVGNDQFAKIFAESYRAAHEKAILN